MSQVQMTSSQRMRVRSATCFLAAPLQKEILHIYTLSILTNFYNLLHTPYTATRVKNLIEFGVITRNPKTLFKDNLPRKKLTVHLPPCCTLPVKCNQCQPVNILLVYWC